MIGKTNRRFWRHFDVLPANVQKLAREKYAVWKNEPHHPSLGFEERRNGICVVRIGEHYRAIGVREDDVVVWFWIGTHESYRRNIRPQLSVRPLKSKLVAPARLGLFWPG